MWDTGIGQVRQFGREIGIVALLLLSVGVLYGARTTGETRLANLQNEVKADQAQIAQLTSSLASVPQMSPAALRQAVHLLPTKLDIPLVLQRVNQLASSTSVQLQSFQLAPPGASGGGVPTAGRLNLKVYPVDVTVEGKWTQILAFTRGLENGAQLTGVDRIVIANAAAGQVTASISYSLYVHPGA